MAELKAPSIRPRFSPTPSVTSDFWTGFTAPVSAMRFLFRRPSLWKYTLVGALVTVLVFIGSAGLAIAHFDTIAGALWAPPESTAGTIAWWVLAIVSMVALLGASVVVSVIGSQIVMAPLYSRLGERIEKAIIPEGEFEETLLGTVRDELRGVAHSIVTLLVFALVMVPIVALNLVPVIGALGATVLGAVVSSFTLAFEFGDNCLSRRKARWHEKIGHAFRELPTTLGLGAGLGTMMLVPVVDFFLVPVAVVAGTMVFCGLHESGRIHVPDRRIARAQSASD